MNSAGAAVLAFISADGEQLLDWGLAILFVVVGSGIGFLIVWALTRHIRRAAHEQAAELIEVARREAAVAAEELKQKAESEIQDKRAEMNREFVKAKLIEEPAKKTIGGHG